MHYVLLGIGVVLNAIANIQFKAGANELAKLSESQSWWKALPIHLLIGVACSGMALVVYTLALKKIDLSVGYPIMTSLGLLIVSVYSMMVFGEAVTPVRWGGIALIITGLVIVCRS